MRKSVLFILLLLVVGCRTRLNSESTVNVDVGEKQYRLIDPIANAQKVNVSATAASGTFNLYIFLDKDKADAEKEIDQGKPGAKVLAHKLKATQADLSATIPANEKGVVMITADGKKADLKLKITN